MQLMSVVLPEPFGPIRPKRSPGAMSRLTPDSAVKPPKCFDTLLYLEERRVHLRNKPDDAVRRQHHEEHQQHADHQHVDLVGDGHGDDLLDRAEQQRADHRADPVPGAADHRHGQRRHAPVQAEARRRLDEREVHRHRRAGRAHQRARHHAGEELQLERRHAGALGRLLRVADRAQAAPDPATPGCSARRRPRSPRAAPSPRTACAYSCRTAPSPPAAAAAARWRRRRSASSPSASP